MNLFYRPISATAESVGCYCDLHIADKLTDLNHIWSHLPSLHVGVVNDDRVRTSFKSLLGYGIKLAQEDRPREANNVVLAQLW